VPSAKIVVLTPAVLLLLALLPMWSCGGDPPGPSAPAGGVLFEDASARVGLEFEHFVGATGEYFMPEIMSGGVALLDYDLDGDLDILLTQGEALNPGAPPSFPEPEDHFPGPRLYRNDLIPGGDLRFSDATQGSGLGPEGYGMGVAVGDYDNDGDPDVYLTRFGQNTLYRNNGDGTFARVAAHGGLDEERWSASASFFDYDLDGNLDLFWTNYVDFTVLTNKTCFDSTGAPDYCTPTVYRSVQDRLLRNEGDGRFSDVSVAAGFAAAYGNGLGSIAADFNGDSWPDIYVANDGTDNQLWMSDGKGRFENTALMAGAAYNADGRPEAGMGVTAADFDGDGDEDLFMTHLAQETNTLYLNDGGGRFRDATNRFGLGGVSLPYTGFGSRWFDYDNDGRLDLFVANGGVTIIASQRADPYPFRQRNQLYRGTEQGFTEVSELAGAAFELEEVGRGAAFGDVDNDGDVDVVVANNNGPARLLLNLESSQNSWLRVRLEGAESNREGIGARVGLLRSDKEPLWRRAHRDGSYQSSSERTLHFGLGADAAIEGLRVIWPSGRDEVYRGIEARTVVDLKEGDGEAAVR